LPIRGGRLLKAGLNQSLRRSQALSTPLRRRASSYLMTHDLF
jgi:hypothetical protein